MMGEQSPANGVDLAEGDRLKPGPLQAEAEAADTGKQVKQPHSFNPSRIVAARSSPALAAFGASRRMASARS